MKKLSVLAIAIFFVITISSTLALAQPASKATAQLGDLQVVPADGQWHKIFSQQIKSPSYKDLFINLSLETGLTTNTKVMSKQLARAISSAEAMVKVRVLVDGVPVIVGNPFGDPPDTEITLSRRKQTLVAEFAGDISQCLFIVDGVLILDEECIEPEMLALILDTMTANSFNFIAPDLSSGEHTVEVEAMLYWSQNGDQLTEDGKFLSTNAYLGHGSVTVQLVRMIKNEDVVVDLE